MDIVNEVLQKAAREAEKFKPITVDKHLEVQLDVGNLLAFDTNEVDLRKLRSDSNEYLKELTRDNTQLLLNKVWELPTAYVEDTIVAEMPKPTYVLPRSLPVPKAKELTKWEKFAKEKGIVKTKKSKLTWDEALKKWVPRYGYRKAAAEKEKDWVIEVPGNADPMEDQFDKKRKVKRENVAKNELQRMRNIAAAHKVKVPRVGMLPAAKVTSKDISRAVTIAKASTASGGKFQAQLPKEKTAKDVKDVMPVAPYKKRKPLISKAQERKSNIEIVDRILYKKPKLDMEAAVNKELYRQDAERAEEKKTQKPKAGKGGKKRGGKRGKGGKGARVKGKNGGAGRKRR
ncbi:hypothetical protein ONE63_007501 [Megalurothrips usitatus]|uniref:Ribosome biogenesis regulatory protein n=2 Tax=Megalurothrips usitatus TaxID=439358 RepID=A0AAV7XR95_9NEOP|nr:hypothetical protein ONE63_007501 [Megalurothrips usitatus]